MMQNVQKKFGQSRPDDDDITQEEVSMLGKAMKKKKFRGLIQEYVDEVTDPNNRAEYDQYLNELEAKREMPKGMELLRPEPGICVLTHLRFPSGQKQEIYINFCHSQYVQDVGMQQQGSDGSNVSLPFTMAPPRPDKSPNGDTCMTCDFAVSTMTLARCVEQPQLIKLMVDIAADHLTQNFLKGKEEVLKDFKVTDLKCKGGTPMPMSVKEGTIKRDRESKRVAKESRGDIVTPSELRQMKKDARGKMGLETSEKTGEAGADDDEEAEVEEEIARIRVPKHRLLHVGTIDWSTFLENTEGHKDHRYREVPKELKLVVELPTVKKVSECDLDVSKDNVVLEVAEKFYLDLPLPFEIDSTNSSAKFDKNRTPSELVIVMPVVPKVENLEKPSFAWEEPAIEADRLDDSEDELPALEEVEEPSTVDESAEKQESPADEAAPPASPTAGAAAAEPPAAAPAPSAAPVRREKLGEDDPDESLAADADFIAAEAWSGARAGFVFKTGDQGLGYYRDKPFAPPPRKAPSAGGLPEGYSRPAPVAAPAEDFLVREVRRKPKTE